MTFNEQMALLFASIAIPIVVLLYYFTIRLGLKRGYSLPVVLLLTYFLAYFACLVFWFVPIKAKPVNDQSGVLEEPDLP